MTLFWTTLRGRPVMLIIGSTGRAVRLSLNRSLLKRKRRISMNLAAITPSMSALIEPMAIIIAPTHLPFQEYCFEQFYYNIGGYPIQCMKTCGCREASSKKSDNTSPFFCLPEIVCNAKMEPGQLTILAELNGL